MCRIRSRGRSKTLSFGLRLLSCDRLLRVSQRVFSRRIPGLEFQRFGQVRDGFIILVSSYEKRTQGMLQVGALRAEFDGPCQMLPGCLGIPVVG